MQVELFETRPAGFDVSPDDLYDTAVAYMAEGFSRHKPQLVATAHQLLIKLDQQSQTSPGPTTLGMPAADALPETSPLSLMDSAHGSVSNHL